MCTRAVAVPLQARSSGAAVLWQGYRSAVATPMLWHCGNRSDKLYAASLPKLCKRFAKQTHELCDTMLRLALIKPTTKLQETTFWGLGLGGLQRRLEKLLLFSPPCGCALWPGRGQRLGAAANER